MITENRKIEYLVHLLNLVRDLSEDVKNPSFREIMDQSFSDDRLTETIIALEDKFPAK